MNQVNLTQNELIVLSLCKEIDINGITYIKGNTYKTIGLAIDKANQFDVLCLTKNGFTLLHEKRIGCPVKVSAFMDESMLAPIRFTF